MAIAPVNKVTPAFVEQLNDNFSTIKTAVDAVEATAADTLTKSANLAGLVSEEEARGNLGLGSAAVLAAAAANGAATLDASAKIPAAQLAASAEVADALGGVIPSVENVTALQALTIPYKRVRLEGWTTKGDGGGGILDYDAASSATANDGLVFAPAITGRYTRPADGVLHSRWFGLKNDSTGVLDQSARMQAFFDALVDHGSDVPFFRGFIDPDTINCQGATLYLSRRFSLPNVGINVQIDGASKGFSVIRNAHISVGSVGDFDLNGTATVGGASQIKFSNFRIQGFVDLWTPEISSKFEWMQILNPTIVMSRTFTDPTILTTWPDLDDYLLNEVQGNHFVFDSTFISETLGAPTRSCARLKVCANTHLISGGVTNGVKGLVLDGGGSTKINRFKSEGVVQESFWVKGHIACHIETYARSGFEHDFANYPIIRIGGDLGVDAPKLTTIRNSTFIADNPASTGPDSGAVAIEFRKGQGLHIDGNWFEGSGVSGAFLDCIKSQEQGIALDIGPNNRFEGTEMRRVSFNTTATFAEKPAEVLAPNLLTAVGSTISWDAAKGDVRKYQLLNGASATLNNPTNFIVGKRYRLILTKATSTGTITTFGAMYKFASGVTPTTSLSSMTAAQHAVLDADCVDDSSGTIFSCSFEIRG